MNVLDVVWIVALLVVWALIGEIYSSRTELHGRWWGRWIQYFISGPFFWGTVGGSYVIACGLKLFIWICNFILKRREK